LEEVLDGLRPDLVVLDDLNINAGPPGLSRSCPICSTMPAATPRLEAPSRSTSGGTVAPPR
jgi:hypothetical protein